MFMNGALIFVWYQSKDLILCPQAIFAWFPQVWSNLTHKLTLEKNLSKICWVQFHIEFSSDKFFRGRCTQIVLSWKISGNFHWIFFWFFSIVFKSSDLPIYKKLEVNGLFRQIFTKKLKNIPINNLWHWPDATLLRKKFKFFWYGQPQNYYHPSVIERSWLDFISVVKKIVLNHAFTI